ncbi:MAG TPA: L-glutamate gamma-semialdehyde dehydrogenase [Cytophagaceae bacterium]|nr:L-glutamate gamma-semialdehyde dehydrogenase [Cytophagaceae bacterium]
MNDPNTTINEPVLNYKPGAPERLALELALQEARSQVIEIPMYIGDQKIHTNKKVKLSPPHDHQHLLGYFSEGDATHVSMAIEAALQAKKGWSSKPLEERAKIFKKAADLIAGKYRAKLNAATMLGQSKNAYQAEIDSACEMIDFLRFNVQYLYDIQKIQPYSPEEIQNELEYRPLEGFVFAITPFNFTAIAGNLPAAPALAGNTVIWKPAYTQIYSAQILMEIFLEAGLPPGVINLIYVDGSVAGEVIFKHPDFAGLHFTGSTGVFRQLWKTIADHLSIYRSFPKIVGETGGKDFVIAHPSAKIKELATALIRGAFEYQGQKCSAASRAYIPASIWPAVKELMIEDLKTIKMGPVEDLSNFVNAVIDERAFDRIASYIRDAVADPQAEIIWGGKYDKTSGYFIEPTIILVSDPNYKSMREEIFGPVLSIYVYKDEEYEKTLELVDQTSPYALTGAVFAEDAKAIQLAKTKLINAAGNFYINDKPTGAVVNQQPFGGARASGTNDKAGAVFNMLRWVNPRTIKKNLNPPGDYRYPFME